MELHRLLFIINISAVQIGNNIRQLSIVSASSVDLLGQA